VAEYLRRTGGLAYQPEQVLITAGGKYALFEAFQAVLNPGDEAVLPAPYWVSYAEQIAFAGAKAVVASARSDEGFKVSPRALAAAITPRTRAVVLNSPSNPTGVVYTRAELAALADVLAGKDFWVFSDEIYNELLYDGVETASVAALRPDLAAQTITFGGASKTWAMTGWRIGWAAGPAEVIRAMDNLQSHSTSNPTSIAMHAALAAVTGDEGPLRAMLAEFDRRRRYMVERLGRMPGVRCVRPQGAFYCFPDVSAAYERLLGGRADGPKSIAFAEKLLAEAKVAVVPGAAFGDDACVRLSFATGMEAIEKGLDRIEKFLHT
jgi:aspartate aminotransferase